MHTLWPILLSPSSISLVDLFACAQALFALFDCHRYWLCLSFCVCLCSWCWFMLTLFVLFAVNKDYFPVSTMQTFRATIFSFTLFLVLTGVFLFSLFTYFASSMPTQSINSNTAHSNTVSDIETRATYDNRTHTNSNYHLA